MQVIFRRTNKPAGLLIQLLTLGRWEHVGIVDGADVIHSAAFGGVTRTTLKKFKDGAEWEIAEIEGDPQIAVKLIGKKYDWLGLIGLRFMFGRPWNDPDRWFCSELVAECSPVFRKDVAWRVTPKHIYLVSHESKEIEIMSRVGGNGRERPPQ